MNLLFISLGCDKNLVDSEVMLGLLAKEGYLAFSRGRYGGTFVVDIPETGEETFKWLAVNPQYAEVYNIGKNKN